MLEGLVDSYKPTNGNAPKGAYDTCNVVSPPIIARRDCWFWKVTEMLHAAVGERTRLSNILFYGLLALSLIWSFTVFVYWIDIPVLDSFGFRQAQTAISAFYILKDGIALDYQTPVLGQPWSIPFEFPTYQVLTALLASTSIPLDVAGRIVSFSFFLACLIPIRSILLSLGFQRDAFYIVSSLFLSSSLYVFCSRTVMIESAALFFCVLWLALVARYIFTSTLSGTSSGTSSGGSFGAWIVVGALAAGTLGVLTKATTFPAFCVVGCLFVVLRLRQEVVDLRDLQRLGWRRAATLCGVTLAMCLIPIVFGALWVGYTDTIKSSNPYGALLTAEALSAWNFGTFAQRTSEAFWVGVVLGRAAPEVLGYGVWLAPLVMGAAIVVRGKVAAIVVFLLGFLTPLLVFTNLHAVHNYYQYANGLFLILALGVAIAAVAERLSNRLAAGLVAVFVAGNFAMFWTDYLPLLQHDWQQNETIRIAQEVRNHTPQDSGLVMVGADWSSEIPYYSQRRMLALAAWFPPDIVAPSLEDPQGALGQSIFSGVVACGGADRYQEPLRTMVSRFLSGRAIVAEAGTCRLLTADRPLAGQPLPPPTLTSILSSAKPESFAFEPAAMAEGIFAHAPAVLVAEVEGPRSLNGSFGYLDSAWQSGDPAPVTFSIRARHLDGETPLFEKTLNPAQSLDDRGPQAFSMELPEGKATLVFETKGARGDNVWAWTYWGDER
jgi:hypothetical protein